MLMEQYHLTEKDEEVREVDCPERLFVEMHKIPSFELQGLADYIYNTLFGPDAPEQLVKVRMHCTHLISHCASDSVWLFLSMVDWHL